MGETAGVDKGSRSRHLSSHCDDQPIVSHVNPWHSSGQQSQYIYHFTDNQQSHRWRILRHHSGPDFDTIFSILPFSREQLSSVQGDDGTLQGLSISPSTSPTNRIEVQEHQGLLYRLIQKGDDIYKIQLIVPKTLVQWTMQHFHQRTAGKHHGQLKTLLQILGVPWWPSVHSDVWRFIESCKSCGVEAKEDTVINPSKKPPHHPPHPRSSASATSSTKETRKPDRRKHQGGWRTSMAECNIVLGGAAVPAHKAPEAVVPAHKAPKAAVPAHDSPEAEVSADVPSEVVVLVAVLPEAADPAEVSFEVAGLVSDLPEAAKPADVSSEVAELTLGLPEALEPAHDSPRRRCPLTVPSRRRCPLTFPPRWRGLLQTFLNRQSPLMLPPRQRSSLQAFPKRRSPLMFPPRQRSSPKAFLKRGVH